MSYAYGYEGRIEKKTASKDRLRKKTYIGRPKMEISKFDNVRDDLWEIEKCISQLTSDILAVISKINEMEMQEEKETTRKEAE